MSAQVQLLRARTAVPAAAPPVQPVPWAAGPSSDPQITLSPATPASGHATASFLYMIVGTAGTFGRVYLRDPGTGLWGALPASAYAPLTWLVPQVFIVNAAELYFETDAQPLGGQAPLVLVMELGS